MTKRRALSEGETWLKQEWRTMLRRLVPHIEHQSADIEKDTVDMPVRVYTDPERLEAERRVFLEVPLLAGLSTEIPEPGDRILFDEAGPPIIVVRAQDGSVKAWLNLCPHRGSRLVSSCGGGLAPPGWLPPRGLWRPRMAPSSQEPSTAPTIPPRRPRPGSMLRRRPPRSGGQRPLPYSVGDPSRGLPATTRLVGDGRERTAHATVRIPVRREYSIRLLPERFLKLME